LGRVGDDHRQRGLACARRPPQDDRREQPVGLDGAPQQFALPQDVLLPDELLQPARAHARRQRRLALHALLHGVVEKVCVTLLHGVYPGKGWLSLNYTLQMYKGNTAYKRGYEKA